MKPAALCLALLTTAFALPSTGKAAPEWPPLTREVRPWTRWWWLGNAVEPVNLTRELASFAQAGLGGVEITPIYGVRGREREFIDFLSPRWVAAMQDSVAVATEADLGVDMTTGTGWCFGGPNVSSQDANAAVRWRTFTVPAGGGLGETFDPAQTQALVAYPADGAPPVEITDRLGTDGRTDWTAPPAGAPWTVYAVSQQPSGVVVKRPAPGGAGPMLNLLYEGATERYLERFGQVFDSLGPDAPKPAALFHDSYEYRSDWAPDFFAQFEKRRGYRLQTELPALFGTEQSDHTARVKSDYRETISDLLAEVSIPAWTRWAHAHGFRTREQAHGSPGNWLDIYAAADVPETEMFNQDQDILVAKFAASAAHVAGRNVVGAEAGTWAAEHFTETLADLKGVVDRLLLAGVNRVTFHGTAYSPHGAPWPGWCFYASTELNPRNALWHDLPALNAYVARVQAVLQASVPNNDVLLYWPIYDRWHDARGLVQAFTIHGREWFHAQPVGAAAEFLEASGYQFDYVSDRQLAALAANPHSHAPGWPRTVVVPACTHLPPATLNALLTLADQGTTVVFQDHLPTDVPGLSHLEERQEELQKALAALGPLTDVVPGTLRRTAFEKTPVLVGDLAAALPRVDACREPMVSAGPLHVVRRAWEGTPVYFVVNTGGQPLDRWVPLGRMNLGLNDHASDAVYLMDPLSGAVGRAASRREQGGEWQVRLQMEPGASLVLRVAAAVPGAADPAWHYHEPAGPAVVLAGKWQVDFVEGGPTLPPPVHTETLGSWTNLGGPEAQAFAGTARYTLTFDMADADPAQVYALDLGEVRASARVRLNGEELGTVFTRPFRVFAHGLKPGGNVLEVEATGTSANRIRDLDGRKVPWKIFYDANVVNKDYKPFDASGWPVAAQGLLGPVTLQRENSSPGR